MKYRLNDRERILWVENDEPLCRWWLSTRKGITTFVRENRAEIDAHIHKALGQ